MLVFDFFLQKYFFLPLFLSSRYKRIIPSMSKELDMVIKTKGGRLVSLLRNAQMLYKTVMETNSGERKYYFPSSETVSFFLPRDLRAAKTLRPLTVDILNLNPCLFFLFLTDGWKVLFMVGSF
jgi:hypothetical protein